MIIAITILCLAISSFTEYHLIKDPSVIYGIVIGVILAFLIEFLVRLRVMRDMPTTTIEQKFELEWQWLIPSPGYFFANLFKEKISEIDENKKKQLKSTFITNSNILNLRLSAFIFLICFVLFVASEKIENPTLTFILSTLTGLISYRNLSRSCEIIYAFIKDVLSDKMSSSLDKFQRIRLAMNSYIENVFNFASLYYVFSDNKNPISSFFISLGRSTLANVSPEQGSSMLNVAIYGQVLTSLTLVVLSLAIYAGRSK